MGCDSEAADPAGPPELEEPVEPLPPELPEGGGDLPGGAGGPVTVPSCRAGDPDRVTWGDVEQNLNMKVALLGPVSAIYRGADGSIVLEMGDVKELPGAKPVKVTLLPNTMIRLPASPEELYSDRIVCAVGVPQRIGDEIRLQINEPRELYVVCESQ